MVNIEEDNKKLRDLKEELWKLALLKRDLLDPEVLILSKKIDELLNENDKLMLTDIR